MSGIFVHQKKIFKKQKNVFYVFFYNIKETKWSAGAGGVQSINFLQLPVCDIHPHVR